MNKYEIDAAAIQRLPRLNKYRAEDYDEVESSRSLSKNLNAHEAQHAETSNQNHDEQDQPPPEILEDDSSYEEVKASPHENADHECDGRRYRDQQKFRLSLKAPLVTIECSDDTLRRLTALQGAPLESNEEQGQRINATE